MTLPFDYSRCTRSDCTRSRNCARYLCPGRENYQLHTDYNPDNCENFIEYK